MKNMPNKKDMKKDAWEFAFGLIKVDGLEPTEYLKELSKMEIEGKIDTKKILDLILKKYQAKENL